MPDLAEIIAAAGSDPTADPALALQLAVTARLTGDTALTNYFGEEPRVYARVPAKDDDSDQAAFPYITLGTVQILEDETECSDSSTGYFDLQAWARGPNATLIVKRLIGLSRRALRVDLDLSPWALRIVVQGFEKSLFKQEPDGLTESGTGTWFVDIEPRF